MHSPKHILHRLLHSLKQPLKRNVINNSHRIHGNLQLFVRMPCSGTHLHSFPRALSATSFSRFTSIISSRSVNCSDKTRFFILTSSPSKSDNKSSLFMNGLDPDASPSKKLTAPYQNKSQTVVNPQGHSSSQVTIFLPSKTSITKVDDACRYIIPAPLHFESVLRSTSGSLYASKLILLSRTQLWFLPIKWEIRYQGMQHANHCSFNEAKSFVCCIPSLQVFL